MRTFYRFSLAVAFFVLTVFTAHAQNHVLVLDGNDNIDLPETATMASPSSAITMEALLYLESYQDGNIIASGNQNDYSFAVRTDKKLYVHLYGVSTGTTEFVGQHPLALHVWHHVAFTFDGTHGRFYINGVLDAEIARSGSIQTSPQSEHYSIGSTFYNGSYNFFTHGKLDEVRLWDVARSQAQIQANMCAALGANDRNGLLGYWQFESAYADASGNANHGIPVGNASIAAEDVDVCSSPVWRQLATTNDPPGSGFGYPTGYSVPVFDAASNVIMIVNQANGYLYTLDLQTGDWTETVTTNRPGWLNWVNGDPNGLHFDTQRNKLYCWHSGFFYTASLDLATHQWSTLTTVKADDAFASGLTYDSKRDRMVSFGGYGMWSYKNRLRYYDKSLNTWSNYPASGSVPGPSTANSIVYEPGMDKVFMVGGHSNNDCDIPGIYSYDLTTQTWTKHLDPDPTHHHGWNNLSFMDGSMYAAGGRILGCGFPTRPNAASYTNDVFTFSSSGPYQFDVLQVSGMRPEPFDPVRVFADPQRSRLIVFGPRYNLHIGSPTTKEVWFLEWDVDPIADAGPDQTVECTAETKTNVLLDGSGSSDPNNITLTYEWSLNGSTIAGPTSNASSVVSLPVGVHTVTLTVTNGSNHSATDDVVITIEDNTPPSIGPLADVTVPTDPGVCTRSTATLSLTPPAVTDLCSSAITLTNDAPAVFPLGSTTVTWTATDGYGNISSVQQLVTIIDDTPPQIAVTLSPGMLWPPNHKMKTISAVVTVSDNCTATYTLHSITSNEPDNGLGDGDTENDIQGAVYDTDDLSFSLRAERSGLGSGRVYTIVYRAVDGSSNESFAQVTVTVPHAMNKDDAPIAGEAALRLEQNYPNPFNPSTLISYTVPERGHVHLSVHDLLGRSVLTLVDQVQKSGTYHEPLSLHDQPSGTYIYRLDWNGQTLMRQMVLKK